MFELLSIIDWRTVFITLAVSFVLFNTVQIVRYSIIKKKAKEEIQRIDSKIAGLNQELETTKKALQDKINKLQK